ncbi:TetR/AcrR family transcriptional regulator [Mycolicibacillus parakoreensis]|uniref:TetR/AcrR family transcriptional regulator n=1 Tax=Mycolicibacillus parakoreensis TaxID=1069221 RepID=A0ABY3U2S4_9MYCO|nr:TetR/AcrR family transcriptional regulator [Mycolicibacillus parakoreensis]MCV7317532.1 TetR/AcrR family transcriptional regulator [Mycolicibacillus parakoreensis]ULN54246.1 TetR/AcrR family transcriptional regulator [Mycolicibacillus parakoreensis]
MAARVAPRRPAHGNQARAERTRALAIDETVRCVLDEGIAAASAKHIAERAGMTWGVIQYHFGDRDGLLMAVVDQGFAELLDALGALGTPDAAMGTEQRVQQVVDAAWDAMSSATSRAAVEILIGTRATRGAGAAGHLDRLAQTFGELGRAVGADLDASQSSALGTLLLTNLRGLVATQLIMDRPVDTARERRTLVKVLGSYLDRHR